MVKEISINRETQATKRYAIDKQAQMIMAYMETDYKMFEAALKDVSTKRDKIIDTMCDLARSKVLDDSIFKMCQFLLDSLSNPELSINRITSAHYQTLAQQHGQSSGFLLENKN